MALRLGTSSVSPTHSTKGLPLHQRSQDCLGELSRPADPSWRERYVVEQIKSIGADPSLIEATIREANKEAKETIKGLDRELAALKSDVQSWTSELPTATASRQDHLHERLAV